MHDEELESLEGMSDEEFCRMFGEEWEAILKDRNDEDYVINRPQWMKMLRVLKYFSDLADSCNGELVPTHVQPCLEHGGVTVYFTVLDLQGNDIIGFCHALALTNAVTIDSTTDGRVCISVSIPNVYIHK